MTSHDTLTADLQAWFDGDARASIPAAALDRALSVTVGRRPWPARVAALGSHRIGSTSSRVAALRVWPLELPSLRSRYAIPLVILLLLLLAAGMLLVGSRLIQQPSGGGSLVYALDGDIYLANADGANAHRVADGMPDVPCPSSPASCDQSGPSYLLGDGGPAWAPDGRHFLFFRLAGQQETGYIGDADGHIVASIPGMWVDATWSPDSTRLEAWIGGNTIPGTRLGIYGVDGVLQASLPVPAGHVRLEEHGGLWTPDGNAVWTRLGQGNGSTTGTVWQFPTDGSAPSQLAADNEIAALGFDPGDPSMSRDGSGLAATSTDGSLVLTDPLGRGVRVLVDATPAGSDGGAAYAGAFVWSPSGTQIAYEWTTDYATYDIRIVQVTSGDERTLIARLGNGGAPLSWSAAGDRILFSEVDQEQRSSLWSVAAAGGAPTLVVDGADSGAWRPTAP